MKTFLLAAITAGVLSFGVAAPQAEAANVGVGINNNGVHIGINNGNRWRGKKMWHNQHCRWVPVWRHHHRYMVKKCW